MSPVKRRLPKSNRKARRLRINLSGATFGGVEYQPDEKTWSELEQALGQQIPNLVRDRLSNIVEGYFGAQPYESSSPFLDDVLASAEKIKSETIVLRETLRNQAPVNKAVRLIIGRQSKIRGVKPGPDQLRMVEHALTSLINAASQSQRYFESQPGFEEGDEWAYMIRAIRKLFREHGLRAGASQDANKGTASRFVLFVEALQKSFPAPELRRHYGIGAAALAKQINRIDRKRDINTRDSLR
jgi:hypothetical protein